VEDNFTVQSLSRGAVQYFGFLKYYSWVFPSLKVTQHVVVVMNVPLLCFFQSHGFSGNCLMHKSIEQYALWLEKR